MRADAFSIAALLSSAQRFEVPFFQRRYRWRPQRNWGPFADAVLRNAEAVRSGLGADQGLNFVGAMVFRAVGDLDAPPDVAVLEILDGQQRLITASVAIRALIDLHVEMGRRDRAIALWPLLVAADGAESPRIRPSAADAEDLARALAAGRPEAALPAVERDRDVPDHAAIRTARRYMRARFEAYLHAPDPEARLDALETALLRRTQAVAVRLGPGANAFEVFEQLNNLGERLSKLDLVKNQLFGAAAAVAAPTALIRAYEAHWSVFDAPEAVAFWSEPDQRGDGRSPPRPDVFLRAYLSGLGGEQIPFSALETRLARQLTEERRSALDMIAEMGRAGAAFLEICAHRTAVDGARQIRALRLFGAASADPLLLAARQHLWGDQGAAMALLDAVESCLVRRYVCDMTGGFDVFARAAGLICRDPARAAAAPEETAAAVTAYLAAPARRGFWPSDAEFEDGWRAKTAYHARRGDKKRIFHYVFERLEAALAVEQGAVGIPTDGSDDAPGLEDPMTIEHLWPPGGGGRQGWRRLSPAEAERLNSFGNLLPVPESLNQELGRRSWSEKRALLDAAPSALTRDLIERPEWRESWDLEQIDARTRRLFELAATIWPRSR